MQQVSKKSLLGVNRALCQMNQSCVGSLPDSL